MQPPTSGGGSHIFSTIAGVAAVLILLSIVRQRFDPGGGSLIAWVIGAAIGLGCRYPLNNAA